MDRRTKRAAVLLGACGLAAAVLPSGIRAGATAAPTYRADLVVVCSTGDMLRLGAVNDSPRDVVVSADEIGVRPHAPVELLALFPMTIPAGTDGGLTVDLRAPTAQRGHGRQGLVTWFHGLRHSSRWDDENGLTYRSKGGAGGWEGQHCPTLPATTTTTTTTTTSTTTSTTTDGSGTPGATTAPTSSAATSTAAPVPDSATTAPAPEPSGPQDEPDALVELRPVGWASTINSQLAALAFDGDLTTSFVTQMADGAPPTWAWVAADLGRVVELSRIEWWWADAGIADDVTVRTSVDARHWTVLATESGPTTGAWQGVDAGTDAVRYVRLYFRNPNRDPQLGGVAELRFLAAEGAPGADGPAAATTFPTGPVVETRPLTDLGADDPGAALGERRRAPRSSRSSNSPIQSSRLAVDGDPTTGWHTAMSVPPWTGWVRYDLTEVAHLGAIRWTFSAVGSADSYRIQVSQDGSTWKSVAVLGNAPAAGEWQTLRLSEQARYVRFYFRNPNRDANLGYLGEVEFYSGPA